MRDNSLTMNDTATLPPLPDRLSIDPSSPFHNPDVFQREIGIRFNDKDRHDVEEYCLSEGWIKVAAGKTLDRKGKPMLIKLKGGGLFYRGGVLANLDPRLRGDDGFLAGHHV